MESSSSSSASSSSSSSSLSLVSRAKTAFHSAAAKAEKVLTDIKADLKTDRDGDGQSHKALRKATEQATIRPDPSTKLQEEVSGGESLGEEDSSDTSQKVTIPLASVIKQLAAAVESGKNFKSMKDILTLGRDSSPAKEKAGLSFSAVKLLVLREKEEKSNPELYGDEEVNSLICVLFHSEEHFPQRNFQSGSAALPMTYLPKDIHGAPPESFVVRLSEIIGSFKSLQKMALFWHNVINELKRLWSEGQPIPRMPLDVHPDLNSCLLHQQLQVINCCIARKQRQVIAVESLDSVLKEASPNCEDSVHFPERLYQNPMIYARINTGDYVLRLGADHPSEDLTMIETGEPIYSPVTQEDPILTEELIKETEEFILRTGSVGAGCSQLLSDMQAFKAANPGCILEDFIRWHSPPDWTEMESDAEANDSADVEDLSCRKGRLSRRMQKEGNLWRELWETAKALPAVKQTPLFDEDLAVESIFTTLEDVRPPELFEQFFVCALCSGFVTAEAALPMESNLSKLFQECKEYVIATCQSGVSNDSINDLCKVYETIETIIVHPEEAIMIMNQPEKTLSGERKSRFKKISLNFVNKDKQTALHKKASKEERKSDEKHMHVFSHLKTSLFSKKHPKSNILPSTTSSCMDENDWTMI